MAILQTSRRPASPYLSMRRVRRPTGQPEMQPETALYPVRVRGDLDPALSRWQWLVKWILAIPHYIVLFFLHIAYVVVTVIAFFAILFTASTHAGCLTSMSVSCA
ncbi:MAG TPA: hypothetical protein VK449_04750, partial [Anaerolineales bacterium]|nr:hypothetical protein [Anaerolineales bacterium]